MALWRSSAEAATVLGLSPVRVRELIAAGELAATKVGGRWLLEQDQLEAFAHRHRPPGRPLAPDTAWALLALAAGHPTPRLSDPQRSRLRRRLRARPDLVEVAAATRRRCRVEHLRAHPGLLDAIRSDHRAVPTGASAPGHDVVDTSIFEAYARTQDLADLQRRFRLRSARPDETNLVLRIPTTEWWPFNLDRLAWPPVVAVDLLASSDPRSVRAARRMWERTLNAARWESPLG